MFLKDKEVFRACCTWKQIQAIQPAQHLLCGGSTEFRDNFFSMNSKLIKLSFSMDLCQTFPSPLHCNKSTAPSPLLSPWVTSDISKDPFYVPNLHFLACCLGTEQHMLWLVLGYACADWPPAHRFCTAKEAKSADKGRVFSAFLLDRELTRFFFSHAAAVCHEIWTYIMFPKALLGLVEISQEVDKFKLGNSDEKNP